MVVDPKTGYDLYASEYKKDHPHLDSFDWDTAGPLLKDQIQNPQAGPGLKFLDLGCGDGRTLKRVLRWLEKTPDHPWSLFGLDISSEMLKFAGKACPQAQFILGDLEKEASWHRLKTLGPFQGITGFFILVHLQDPPDFFRRVFTILAPGGFFLFNTIPQKEAPLLQARGKKFYIQAQDWKFDTIEASLKGDPWLIEFQKPCFYQNQCISQVYLLRKPSNPPSL